MSEVVISYLPGFYLHQTPPSSTTTTCMNSDEQNEGQAGKSKVSQEEEEGVWTPRCRIIFVIYSDTSLLTRLGLTLPGSGSALPPLSADGSP
ncbi:hypothetical protein O3P69_000337 [Scylla paramamosain]|uniref:Uncharacterized protein n=1 Tax=Scylla paramamosain TaxID=85552 RepID=A0AAW0V019_SCYPA